MLGIQSKSLRISMIIIGNINFFMEKTMRTGLILKLEQDWQEQNLVNQHENFAEKSAEYRAESRCNDDRLRPVHLTSDDEGGEE